MLWCSADSGGEIKPIQVQRSGELDEPAATVADLRRVHLRQLRQRGGFQAEELLELYNVTAWRAAIAKQCKRAADWCLVSPEWNTALNQAKRIKWCINRLHTVWAAPIRSSVCAQLVPTAHMLNMLAADVMRFISLDSHGRSTRIPHAAHRQHNLLRDDSTTMLAMSSLLNATINQGTHLVRRVWRKIFYKAESSQQAAECYWATRTTMQQAQSTHEGRLALSDRVQASIRMWWCILDQHPMWTIAAKAAAMQSTDLQDWFNDNLAELHQSTAICEYQDCLLPAQSPVQHHTVKAVTGSCTLQHALAQWPLWNNGELTAELLEDVQRYKEFSIIVEQANAQLELNTDPEVSNFKTQEVCCKCTKQVTLHNEGNELSTDQCSDCWAESDLWRQLVVHVMHADSLFFENGSGACVRVVDREKWSVRALRRIDPRTRLFFLDVLGYIAADETPLSATDVPPSFSRTRQSYPRQPSRVLRTMERRPADPAVDSICAPVSQPW